MEARGDTKKTGRLRAGYEQVDLEGCKLVGSGGAHDFGMHGDAHVLLIG